MKRILKKDLEVQLAQARADISIAVGFLTERAKRGDASAATVLRQMGYTPMHIDSNVPPDRVYIVPPGSIKTPPTAFIYTGLRSTP